MPPPLKLKLPFKTPSVRTGKVPVGEGSDVAKAISKYWDPAADDATRAVVGDVVAERGLDVSPPVEPTVARDWKHPVQSEGGTIPDWSYMDSEWVQSPLTNTPEGLRRINEVALESMRKAEAETPSLDPLDQKLSGNILGTAATVGAGATALAAGSAEAAPPKPDAPSGQKYSDEFFDKLSSASPEGRRAFMNRLSKPERMEVLDAARAWREKRDAPMGGESVTRKRADALMRTAAGQGYEDPSLRMSVAGKSQAPEPPKFSSWVRSGKQGWLRFGHKTAQLSVPENYAAKMAAAPAIAMLAPWMLKDAAEATVENVDALKREFFDPALRAGQEALRKTPFSSVKGTMLGQVLPERALPLADYLYKDATQWMYGESNFKDMPPEEQLQAINDIEAIAKSPLGSFLTYGPATPLASAIESVTGEQLINTNQRAAFAAGAVQHAGEAPLILLGPTKGMQAFLADSPVVSGALWGAAGGLLNAAVKPGEKVSENVAGGIAVGAGIPTVVKAFTTASALKTMATDLWQLSDDVTKGVQEAMRGPAPKPVTPREPLARSVENAVLGGIAESTPDEFLVRMPAGVRPPNFKPSTALIGADEIRLFEFRVGKKPKVLTVPLNSEDNVKWVREVMDKNLVDPIPSTGAFESTNKYVREYVHGPAQDVSGASGEVFGKTARRDAATNAGAGRPKRGEPAPGVIAQDKDGFIELYRITDTKARVQALSALRPVEATSALTGNKVRGFLIQGDDFVGVHPGSDFDYIPGFTDQIVPIKSDAVRYLKAAEVEELAKLTPTQKHTQELARGFDPRRAEAGYEAMVKEAGELLTKQAAESDIRAQETMNAIKALTVPKVSEKSRKAAITVISATQKVDNFDDAGMMAAKISESTRKDALKYFTLAHKKVLEPSQADATRRLLKQHFSIGDTLAEVLMRDTLGLTKRGGPGTPDHELRQKLLREWAQKGQAIAPMGPVTPRIQRPLSEQFTMPPEGAPLPEHVRTTRMQVQGAVSEAEVAGEDFWVASKTSGTRGNVISYDAEGVFIETKNGTREKLHYEDVSFEPPPPPGPEAFYKVDPDALVDDLADAFRNFKTDKSVEQAIMREARGQGVTQDELRSAIQKAAAIADDLNQPLRKPPPPPPPLKPPNEPPPPGQGPPPDGDGFSNPGELEVVKAALRDKGWLEKTVEFIYGPRAVVPDDIGKLINLVYGAKNLEATVARRLDQARRAFGVKPFEQFDKDLLKTFEGQLSIDGLKKLHSQVMNNRDVERLVFDYTTEKAMNALRLNELGILDDAHVTPEALREYATHIYARQFFGDGVWAEMVTRNKPLMDKGRNVFTRLLEKKGLQGEELKEAADAALHKWIGGMDHVAVDQMVGNQGTGKAKTVLKERVLDSLQTQLADELEADGKTLSGLLPEDVDILKDLLGRNRSGMLAIAATLAKQKALIATGELFRQATTTMPEFFSNTARKGWIQLPLNRGVYGDAAGKYIHPDLHGPLVSVPQYVASANDLLLSMSSWVKGNQIALGGMGTMNTNFFGSMKGALLSGGIDITRTGVHVPHLKRAAELLWAARNAPAGAEARLLDDIIRVGVDAPSFNATELNTAKNTYIDAVLKDLNLRKTVTIKGLMMTGLRAVQKPAQYAGAFYDVQDRLWKIGSYLALLEKAGLKADGTIDTAAAYQFLKRTSAVRNYNNTLPKPAQGVLPPDLRENPKALLEAIKQEGALVITSSFPMPDRVSPAMQEARGAVGFVAPYLTYKSEESRVNAAIIQRIKRGDYALLGRVLAGGVVVAGAGHLSRELGKLNGITDADVEEANKFDSPSNKKYRPGRMVMPVRDSMGRVMFMDFTQYNDWLGTLATATSGDPVADRIKNVLGAVVMAPFSGSVTEAYGKELAWRAGVGDQPFTPKLREDQKGVTATLDSLTRTGILPKAPAWGYDIYRDYNQPASGKAEPATAGQAAARGLGFKVWGVGEASKRARAAESAGEVLGKAKDLRKAASTPDGTMQRETFSGGFDRQEAFKKDYEALREAQEKRSKLFTK